MKDVSCKTTPSTNPNQDKVHSIHVNESTEKRALHEFLYSTFSEFNHSLTRLTLGCVIYFRSKNIETMHALYCLTGTCIFIVVHRVRFQKNFLFTFFFFWIKI